MNVWHENEEGVKKCSHYINSVYSGLGTPGLKYQKVWLIFRLKQKKRSYVFARYKMNVTRDYQNNKRTYMGGVAERVNATLKKPKTMSSNPYAGGGIFLWH